MTSEAQLWIDEYNKTKNGYLGVSSRKRLPYFWRFILRKLNLKKSASVFEIGYGGSKHLINLNSAGYHATGIDCSYNAYQQSLENIKFLEQKRKEKIHINLLVGDILKYKSEKKYDLCFSVGVAEHFLNDHDRMDFYKCNFDLLNVEGYVMVFVPCGTHVRRKIMRRDNLGGYNIPEIDYSSIQLSTELINSGFRNVKIYHQGLFEYFMHIPPQNSFIGKMFALAMYAFGRYTTKFLPSKFKELHAYYLIGVGQK